MKTIKVQVSDDGLFGTPVNEYSGYTDITGETNHKLFAKAHPQHPLTTPQTPNAIIEVLEEPVFQYNTFGLEWKTVGYRKWEIEDTKGRDDHRFAYKVITPVPNSEPKHFAEKPTPDEVIQYMKNNRPEIYEQVFNELVNNK